MMSIPVLFEDQDMMALAKPCGLVVNRASSVAGDTVQDWMESTRPELFEHIQQNTSPEKVNVFISRSGVAHRLDKDTSGILLIGKKPEALAVLMHQFKARTIEKTYEALVHGRLKPQAGEVRAPIRRSTYQRQQFEVHIDGKQAETEYEAAGFYAHMTNQEDYQDGFTRVNLRPKTGRTHQIRVHMKLIGHPLVSDQLYGAKKRTNLDLSWCSRHFLHASKMSLKHPVTGERVDIVCTLPSDLQMAMECLKLES